VKVLLSRRRWSWRYAVPAVFALALSTNGMLLNAQTSAAGPETPAPSEIQQLRQMVLELQARVTQLENERQQQGSAVTATAISYAPAALANAQASDPPGAFQAGNSAEGAGAPEQRNVLQPEDKKILDFLHGTTINVGLDGYYEYNFNAPVGRVNLLRAYDVLSNEFSLNQASVIFDHPPDVADGRRWGGRLDLQFGQATDTLQGNPSNEPRPDIYRNIFQAYGTYVIPALKGINVDFGKFASSLGVEGNYTKDQWNYSRSYWFELLPFYHMGLRVAAPVNDKFTINYWVVNGTNQVEATNGFKDQLFGFTTTPRKTISWTVNYYFGQEHPDRTLVAPTSPIPVQPGLSFVAIRPAPDGRTHIFDTYATWKATPKLSFQVEGDYFIQRLWQFAAPGHSSAPSHDVGGAAYLRYAFTPKIALATRFEYLSDPQAIFSGLTQALKENTVTFDYNMADGFLMRYEWRMDYSNQPSFLTSTQGVLSKQQNTATVGLIWWWGRKEGAW
jgi:hypothetical protein